MRTSIEKQVDALNSSGEELSRLMRLRVERVATKVPPPARLRKRQVDGKVVEMNSWNARKLRDHLTACLEDGIPGPISFVLYGDETK